MLARYLQIAILSALVGACALFATVWNRSPLVLLAALIGTLLGFSGFLLVSFLLMNLSNRRNSVARPSIGQLVQAWLWETAAAAKVFFWWQPCRSTAIADQTPASVEDRHQRGVVFVHGFICNRGLWTRWLTTLESRGIAFAAVNLEPVFGSIDGYAPIVEEAVRRLTKETSQPPLLVCHSMGGLAARAWLRASGDANTAHHIVTLGTPHHGTLVGRFAPRIRSLVNAEQMRFGSEWLAELALHEPSTRATQFTCFYSNCDNIVLPASAAMLDGADNRLIAGVGHLELVFNQQVMDQTLAML